MHLHVGKNNVIGRAFSKYFQEVITVSHKDLLNFGSLERFETISISAFDPLNKVRPLENDSKLLNYIYKYADSSSKMIYFSSARCLQVRPPERHRIYVKNKMVIADKLRNKFSNFSLIYLPNLIPIETCDKSNFVDSFCKNLVTGLVHFDCSLESSWNFVDPASIVCWIKNNPLIEGDFFIRNSNNTTVKDFVTFAKSYNPNSRVMLNPEIFIEYPGKIKSVKNTVSINNSDNTKNFKWLKSRMKLYEQS